ncbi:MAG: hypothetical protein R3A46_15830 [Thermomicrobiales bacterium]
MVLSVDTCGDQDRALPFAVLPPALTEVGYEIPHEPRYLLFLAHGQFLSIPSVACLAEDRPDNSVKDAFERQSRVVDLDDELLGCGTVTLDEQLEQAFGDGGELRQLFDRSEAALDLFEREPLALPCLDHPDALDLVWRKKSMASRCPGRLDQALSLEKTQAGVCDVGILGGE